MKENFPQNILESVELIPLPPLPQTLLSFRDLVEAGAPLEELAAAASLDPSLAAHLLTVANSPSLRKGTATHRLQECLAVIGPRLLRTIVATMVVQNVLSPAGQHLDCTGFWANSLRVAELSRYLAISANYADADEAYLAGLMHDIGQLLLVGGAANGASFPPEAAADVAFRAVLGSRLVERWHLDSFMADAVLFHRQPAREISAADFLSRIVWSAHKLGSSPADGTASPDLAADSAVIGALLGIDTAGIAEACRHCSERVAGSAALLGVDLSLAGQIHLHTLFITREQTFTRERKKDAAGLHLEAEVRTMAAMQPLQESLLTVSGEAELYNTLREAARILFGLGRPVFLAPHPVKKVLTGVDPEGQSPLLTQLEIQLEGAHSLAALAVAENRPLSSFDDGLPLPPSLSDIQISRIMHADGILCVPMRSGERLAGVMVYGLSPGRQASTSNFREWMTGFAAVAARTLDAFHKMREHDKAIAAKTASYYEQLARKVAHEVANPLGIINNYLQIVSEKLGDAAGVSRELAILKEEIARVERIVRKQDDAAGQPPAVETVNVNSVIEGMLALYGGSLFEARGIVIDCSLSAEPPVAGVARDSFKQILLNLWKNSAEAMPEGGRLSIATCVTGDSNCSMIEIRLSDNGPGMPADVMEQLFQPLDPGRRPDHSGVGLSIVASLVEKHCGKISCQSAPDRGTDFTIHLPGV